MKSFRKLVSEVAQPKAEDEINFKAKHEIEKFPHSHAGDETFKGSTKKTPKRRADYEEGNDEKVYEAMDPVGKADADIDNDGDVDSSDEYLHARRKAISKAMKKRKMKEEAELAEDFDQLDEIGDTAAGKKKLKNLIVNRTQKAVDAGASLERRPEKAAEYDRAQKRHMKTIGRAATRLAKEEAEQLEEKAVSQAQQKLMAMALAYKRGEMDDASDKVKELAKSMSEKDLEDFAKTKHKGLPDKVDESSDMDAKMQSILSARRIQKAAREKETGLKRRPGESRASYASRVVNRRNKMQKEEVEQLDELSPNTLHSYIKGASKDLSKRSRMSGYDDKRGNYADGDKNRKRANKRMAGITSASGRLADKANMAESAWEEIPMMKRQLQFISYAAEEISDYLSMGVDPEEWFQNKLAGLHQTMLSMYAYAQGEMQMSGGMYGEEVELDEISKGLAGRYLDKARAQRGSGKDREKSISLAYRKSTPGKRADSGYDSEPKVYAKEELDESSKYKTTDAEYAAMLGGSIPGKGNRKVNKKAYSLDKANRQAKPKSKVSLPKAPWEKNESLDEVTRSAVKRPIKYTDARGVTRTRMTTTRPVQHDEYGQEKIRESLQEAVKPGRLKLDDGSSITVSKKDADLLNQMFNDLNASNRKKMQDTMMSDKDGFEEIVGFAREAL